MGCYEYSKISILPYMKRLIWPTLAFLIVLAGSALALPLSVGEKEDRFTLPSESPGQVTLERPFWELEPAALDGVTWPNTNALIDAHVEMLFERMTDEERVAQLFMIPWGRGEPSEDVMRWIRERNVGGVKVFGWNGEHLPTLTETLATMQRASVGSRLGVPMYTATDQEGGWVRHIKGGTIITPGNLAIGATGLPYDAFLTGHYIGVELRALGVNMNFAPTVDVYNNPEAHVIGPRAFSSDSADTALLGLAFFRGQDRTGVISTAKHFPGHGNATGDSHGILPVIDDDFETIWQRDLLPFRTLIREGMPAILGGHLAFPKITGAGTPATLSPYFNIEVLRNRLDFRGIVVTDDMHMGGATVYAQRNNWTFAELLKESVMAGNDVIMLSSTPAFNGTIWNTLLRAYRQDPAFRRRVEESVRRSLHVKVAYLIPEWRVPLFPQWEEIADFIRKPAAVEFLLDQSARSVTQIRGGDLPFTPVPGQRVLLVGRNAGFFNAGRRAYPGAGELRLQGVNFYTSSSEDVRRLRERGRQYDVIIYQLSDPNTLDVLRRADIQDRKVIVFSILTPIYLRELPWVENAIAVYGWGQESFDAGFAVLRGDFTPPGILPIRMDSP